MEPNANLAPVRGPSVWSRADFSGQRSYDTSRMLIAGAGVGLLAAALARQTGRSGRGWLACTGTTLLALAAAPGTLGDLREWVRAKYEAWTSDDWVNEESELSFPASDPPSWTPTVGSGTPEERTGR